MSDFDRYAVWVEMRADRTSGGIEEVEVEVRVLEWCAPHALVFPLDSGGSMREGASPYMVSVSRLQWRSQYRIAVIGP